MVTMVSEKRVLNYLEAKAEFYGRWLLFDKREFPPEEDKGYVVALGDGTPEDRDALIEICHDKYKGKVLLMKGYVQKDEICENGIIQVV